MTDHPLFRVARAVFITFLLVAAIMAVVPDDPLEVPSVPMAGGKLVSGAAN
ncbi:MAG: hypothetical protein ACT4QA_10190 [Panacagrimonas sp.]